MDIRVYSLLKQLVNSNNCQMFCSKLPVLHKAFYITFMLESILIARFLCTCFGHLGKLGIMQN